MTSSPIVVSASQAASLLAAQEAQAASQALQAEEEADYMQGQVDGSWYSVPEAEEEVVIPQVDRPFDPTDGEPTGRSDILSY